MQVNDLIRYKSSIFRVLVLLEDKTLVINCIKRIMPYWIKNNELIDITFSSEDELLKETQITLIPVEELSNKNKQIVRKRYALISPVLAFLEDDLERSNVIARIAQKEAINKQTIRKYLILYLVFQSLSALSPNTIKAPKQLTRDEKNFRWALNKFYYNSNGKSLRVAYALMLREKYLDDNGNLVDNYPKFHRFRYFFDKTKKLQRLYISRDGMSDYKKNKRPLLGTIRDFAPCIGTAMLDSTVCDIYLIDEANNLVGRPVLTAAVDAYSGMCLGYSLGWEGGIYSLENLMQNVIENKVEYCRRFGIEISPEQWSINALPFIMITDQGREYVGNTFTQLTDLGIKIDSLPPYRPELKGRVEAFFNLVQSTYKDFINNKGIVKPDFQERGAIDYRKTASLTLEQFERIIIYCIIYYNTSTIIDVPYNYEMVENNLHPFPNEIWNNQLEKYKDNLIYVDAHTLALVLLPRTKGRFTRRGLIVNKLRYRNDDFIEDFLKGGDAIVAFDSNNVSHVWLVSDGDFYKFTLINFEYENKGLEEIIAIEEGKKMVLLESEGIRLKNKIELSRKLETITSLVGSKSVNIKDVKKTRNKEKQRTRVSHLGGEKDE